MRSPVVVALLGSMALALHATDARAEGFYWSIAYDPSVPVQSVRNVVTNPSAGGASLGARVLLGETFSLGVAGRWNQFSESHPKTTYAIDNGALTATIHRRVQLVSILPEAYFYFQPDRLLNPYVGLGAGISWVSNKVLASDLLVSQLVRGFTVSPEVGVLLAYDRRPFDSVSMALQSAFVGLRYTFSTAEYADAKNTAFLGVTVGALVY